MNETTMTVGEAVELLIKSHEDLEELYRRIHKETNCDQHELETMINVAQTQYRLKKELDNG